MTDGERKPHESLSGMELNGGWKVLRGAAKSTGATGGHFSCGYIVQNVDGRSGYLKALDFFSMLPDSPDPARDLEPLIRAFNFERDVLETCRRSRRQVVPRWRPWWVTVRLGLADARESVRDVARPDTRTIDHRLEDWTQNPDMFHAGDLISTAFGMGCGDRARDVAEAVLKSDRRVPEPLRLMAERIVNGERPLPSAPLELDAGQRHARIHKLKTRLRAWPNDALTQMDLAREYTIPGQRPKAVRPVTTALALLGRGAFSSRHLSELACALATIELESGNRRMARKLFVAGLQSPTENAAAQAEWAFSEIDNLDLAAQVPPERSYEAEAMSQLGHGNWSFAIENARLWGLDEPFSARAAYFGSWTASVVGNDAVLALQFANLGLSTKPKDKLLLNNKAVALALLGRPEDAQRALQQVSVADLKDGMEATYLATQGMIDYRLGHPALGRALYEKAREISRKQKNMREQAWSLLFQAREERRSDSSAADRLLSEAREKVKALRAREATVVARLLEIVAT